MARRSVGTAPVRPDDTTSASTTWASGRVVARLARTGGGLTAAGRPVRLAGPNAYWLALNDNVLEGGSLPTYPSRATVDATLDAAVAMGANVVRVHTIGISLGKPRTIMPTLDVYDATALDRADYVIAAAKARGLWLSVPLTDRWDYYHGGAQSLVNMVMPSGQRDLYRFWSEPTVRAAFDRYVTTLLNHVNPYTGLRWGDDPTLAMWEVANEFYDLRNDSSSRARHASAAALIKSLAPRALVVDGTGASGGRTSAAPGMTDANVDVLTAHYYNDHAMDTAWLPGDASAAVGASKVFIVGEYDWTDGGNGQADQNASVSRATWLTAIENDRNIAGDLWWTLLVPSAGAHRDRYELYSPPENAEQSAGLSALTGHALAMTATPTMAGIATGTEAPAAASEGALWYDADEPDDAFVESVAGRTGAVILTATDVAETTSRVWMSPTERTRAVGARVDVQVFLTDGTWTKPAGARSVVVEMMGGGGGGGSGAINHTSNTSQACSGAGGGAGGGRIYEMMDAAVLGDTVAVQVGQAGVGGAAKSSTVTTGGNAGTSGTHSIFGFLRAVAGTNGNGGGINSAAANGGGGVGTFTGGNGGAGVNGGQGGSGQASTAGPGGGGGGGVSTGGSGSSGSAGGSPNPLTIIGGGQSGGASLAVRQGKDGQTTGLLLAGGGGSGGGSAGTAGDVAGGGGNGGNYGAGGGGGGSARTDGTTSGAPGAGGNGAPGFVRVTTYLA